MQQLYTRWLERPLRAGHCVACDLARATADLFCNTRCQQRFQQLGMKRVREIVAEDVDAWRWLPDELVVALLEVSYPLREQDATQFRALVAWRHVGARYRHLVTVVCARFEALPDDFTRLLNDAVLTLFPQLLRLQLHSNLVVTDAQLVRHTTLRELTIGLGSLASNAGVQALTQLSRLTLHATLDQRRLNTAPLSSLTRLTDLCLTGPLMQLARPGQLGAMPLLRLPTLPLLHTLRLPSQQYVLVLPPALSAQLTKLNVANAALPGDALAQLTALTSLRVQFNIEVRDAHLGPLTRLRSLDLAHNHRVTHIAHLSALTKLNLRDCRLVQGDQLADLTQLTVLDLSVNRVVDEEALLRLTALRRLALQQNDVVHNVLALTRLTALDLGYNTLVLDVHTLTQLTALNLQENAQLGDDALLGLTLRDLGLAWNARISEAAVRLQTGLTRLNLNTNALVSGAVLPHLPQLRSLVARRSRLTPQDLQTLSPHCLVKL